MTIVYLDDNLDSVKNRLASENNTTPNFIILLPDVKLQDIKKNKKISKSEYLSFNKIFKKSEYKNFILSDILEDIKNKDSKKLASFIESFSKSYIEELVKLWVYVNKDFLSSKRNREGSQIADTILHELGPSWLDNFYENELSDYSKKLSESIEINKKKDEDWSYFMDFMSEGEKLPHTSFNTLSTTYLFKTNKFIKSSDLFDVFNSVNLNSSTLVCLYKDYYKVNSDFKNVLVSINFFTQFLKRKYRKGLEPMYLIANIQDLQKDELKKPSEISSKYVDWIKNAFYIKVERNLEKDGSYRLVFSCDIDSSVDVNKVFTLFLSLFSDKSMSIEDDTLKQYSNGTFYFFNTGVSNNILSELILNHTPFNLILNKNERTKATKTKKNLYLYFKHPNTGNIIPFSLSSKNISQTDPELNSLVKNRDIAEFVSKKEGDYIRVYVTKIKQDEIDYFTDIISKLLFVYNEKKDDVISLYKKYIKSFSDSINYETDVEKKTKTTKDKKVFIRYTLPDIYTEEYSRLCQKKPTIIDRNNKQDVLKIKEFEKKIKPEKIKTIIYPRDGEGDPSLRREYACLIEDHIHPGVKENKQKNKDIYPVVPCCYKKPQEDKPLYKKYFEGEDIVIKKTEKTQLEIATSKFVTWANIGTLHALPKIKELFEIIDPEYDYKRIGCSDTRSSLLECVMSALGLMDKLQTNDSRADFINKVRKELVYSKNFNISHLKQTMYDKQSHEIKELVEDINKYMDPRLFIPLLENMYDVKIYLFSEENNEVTLVNPRATKGYISFDTIYPKTVYIFENKGSESDRSLYPRCELIVKKKNGIKEDPKLLYHYTFPTLRQIDKETRLSAFGNTEELFLKKIGYSKFNFKEFKSQVNKIIFKKNLKDNTYDFYGVGNDDKYIFTFDGKKLVKVKKETKNYYNNFYDVNLAFNITDFIYSFNKIYYISGNDGFLYEIIDSKGYRRFKNISDKNSIFEYSGKISGLISDNVKDLFTVVYEPYLQYIDGYGKTRYVVLRNPVNDVKISVFTDPMPPLSCDIIYDFTDFNTYNTTETKVEELKKFISYNGVELISKKTNIKGSVTELELRCNGFYMYLPINNESLLDIKKGLNTSSSISRTLTGKKGDLDSCFVNKETALFLKEYFIYLFSTWLNEKKIKDIKKDTISKWLDEKTVVDASYSYKLDSNLISFEDVKRKKLFLDPNGKIIINSMELKRRLIYSLALALMLNKFRVLDYHSKKDIKKKKLNFFIDISNRENEIILQGQSNFFNYLKTTFKQEEKMFTYACYQPNMRIPYRLKIGNKIFYCINASSFLSAQWLSKKLADEPSYLDTLYTKAEDAPSLEKSLDCTVFIVKDSLTVKKYNFKGETKSSSKLNILSVSDKGVNYFSSLIELDEESKIYEESGKKELIIDKEVPSKKKKEDVREVKELVHSSPLIVNQGVSCFMNAALQMLYSIKELREFLKKIDFDSIEFKEHPNHEFECKGEENVKQNIRVLTALKNTFKLLKKSARKGYKVDLEEYLIDDASYFEILLQGRPVEQEDVAQNFLYPLMSKFKCFYNNKDIEELLMKMSYFETNSYKCLNSSDVSNPILLTTNHLEEYSYIPLLLNGVVKNNITLSMFDEAKTLDELVQLNSSDIKADEGSDEISSCKAVNPTGKFLSRKVNYNNFEETKYHFLTLNRFTFDSNGNPIKDRRNIKTSRVVTIGGVRFMLKGCIIQIMSDNKSGKKTDLGGGHYVYAECEDGYPSYVIDDDKITNMYMSKIDTDAYVFLYEKI